MGTRYEDILRGVKFLSAEEQLRLISELAATLRVRVDAESSTSVLDLQGRGKEIWQGIDAQEYVHGERASWNA